MLKPENCHHLSFRIEIGSYLPRHYLPLNAYSSIVKFNKSAMRPLCRLKICFSLPLMLGCHVAQSVERWTLLNPRLAAGDGVGSHLTSPFCRRLAKENSLDIHVSKYKVYVQNIVWVPTEFDSFTNHCAEHTCYNHLSFQCYRWRSPWINITCID